MKPKKISKKIQIKAAILEGKQHFAHKSGKIIPARIQTNNIDCSCEIKCKTTLSDEQKRQFFNRYNSLKSHEQQYFFLKSMVIPVTNTGKKIQKFEYFIETQSEKNEVKILFIKYCIA